MCLPDRIHLVLRFALGTIVSWLALAGTSAALDTSGVVSLAWTPNPEADVAGYTVHYGSESGALSQRLLVDASPAATVSGLEPGSTYYFAVQAFNTAGLNSLLSSEISFVVPLPDAPEISLQQASGHILTSGQSTINIGSVTIGGAAPAEMITITNTGASALTDLAVSKTGQDFSVSSLPATTLAPGASMNFTVTFTPSASGSRSASVLVASNDADENPFVVHFTGTGIVDLAPEIAITRADATELLDGGSTLDFGTIDVGAVSATQVLTVKNVGTGNLTGLAITIDGHASKDFTVVAPTNTSLPPGASTTFRVVFNPTAGGIRTAVLHLASNDADENPFDIALTGEGHAFPVLSVQEVHGTSLDPDSTVIPFENVSVGATGQAKSYFVKNLGTAVMTGLQVTSVGADAASFELVLPPVTSLAPGESTTFSIAFKPASHGPKSAAIKIGGNLALQSHFEIGLKGEGVGVPEIAILQDTDLTSDVTVVDFGNRNVGASSPSKIFTIKNLGTANLSGLNIAASGRDSADFKFTAGGATILAPGETTTFSVTFKPSASGNRSAVLVVTSNDSDEGHFNIALAGNGVAAPDIRVATASGKNLKDGAAFINFGATGLNTAAGSQVLTIRNTGTANLTKLSIAKNGLHASDFTVSALKVKSLAPGASTSIKLVFKPRSTGTRWGAIHISSNDADTPTFDIVLTGVGKAAAIANKKKTPIQKGGSPTARSAAIPGTPAPVTGIEVIGGRKYRTLTLTKSSRTPIVPGDIQVSSNLLNWFSGRNHTTTLVNSATTLKVRDNIPVTQEAKRHIRLNPAAASR